MGFGRIPGKQFRKMLKKCAPDHSETVRDHNSWITWQGRGALIPKLDAGHRNDDELDQGWVKRFVRALEIPSACVKKHISALETWKGWEREQEA